MFGTNKGLTSAFLGVIEDKIGEKCMRKILRYWAIIAFCIMVIVFWIVTRPVGFEQMSGLARDIEVESCKVWVKWWNNGEFNEDSQAIAENQFQYILSLMNGFKYRKTWGDKTYHSPDGKFYSMEFEYIVEGEEWYQRMYIVRDGSIYINDEDWPYQVIYENVEVIPLEIGVYLKDIWKLSQ